MRLMSRIGGAALLVLSVLTVATPLAASDTHTLHHEVGESQVSSSRNSHADERPQSASIGQGPSKHTHVCPSNIQDILLSTRGDLDNPAEVDIPFHSLEHCPLFNDPIFHNHPASDSLVDRLLIYVSHRLREQSITHGLEHLENSKWLYFLPPSSIASNSPTSIPGAPVPIDSKLLESAHLILNAPEKPEQTSGLHHKKEHQQPLIPLEAHPPQPQAPTNILAIRVSPLSKAFLEHVLALEHGSQHPQTKLTENDAVAAAATEYEFADSVYTSTLTPQP